MQRRKVPPIEKQSPGHYSLKISDSRVIILRFPRTLYYGFRTCSKSTSHEIVINWKPTFTPVIIWKKGDPCHYNMTLYTQHAELKTVCKEENKDPFHRLPAVHYSENIPCALISTCHILKYLTMLAMKTRRFGCFLWTGSSGNTIILGRTIKAVELL